MTILKNPKHESFCNAYIKHGCNATKAYIEAGYKADEESARRLGSNLLTNIDVKKRIAELQKQTEKTELITREGLIKEMNELKLLAQGEGQLTVMAKVLDMQARMIGAFVEKREITGKDGGPLETKAITYEIVNTNKDK